MSLNDQEKAYINSHGLGIAKYHTDMPSNGRSYTSSDKPSEKKKVFSIAEGGNYSSKTHADESSWGLEFYPLDSHHEEFFSKMSYFEVQKYFMNLYKNMYFKFGTIDPFQKQRDRELSEDLTKQFGNENIKVKCKFSFDGNHEYKIYGTAINEKYSSQYRINLPLVSCTDIEDLKIQIQNYKKKMDDTLKVYNKYKKKLEELFQNDVDQAPKIFLGGNKVQFDYGAKVFNTIEEAYENFLKEEEFKYNQAEENIKKISEKLNFPEISFIYKNNFYSKGCRTIYFGEIEIRNKVYCYEEDFHEEFFYLNTNYYSERSIVEDYLREEKDHHKHKIIQEKFNKIYYPKYIEDKDLTPQWIKEQLLTYRLPYAEGMVKLSKESDVSEEFLWEVFKKTK